MAAYYNEIDPYAAQWLRNLIGKGLIAPGDVDERSIADVRADDLRGYTQCHFFAGIGGWSIALRLAGWPDDRPVWTGSCPCQPFSAAGAGKAADDERHLWPRWFPLIAERRPATVFGEQVEAALGWGWLDLVCADLEGEGYACGAAVLPACGVGEKANAIDDDARCLTCGRNWDYCECVLPGPFSGQEEIVVGPPHIRQRLWFVGSLDHAAGARHEPARQGTEGQTRDEARLRVLGDGRIPSGVADPQRRTAERRGHDLAAAPGRSQSETRERQRIRNDIGASGEPCAVADADGRHTSPERQQRSGQQRQQSQDGCAGELGNAIGAGLQEQRGQRGISPQPSGAEPREATIGAGTSTGDMGHTDSEREIPFGGICQGPHAEHDRIGPLGGFWSDAEWIACTDGKARPVGPGSFPLGHGIPNRASKLRSYGNAIVPQVAAEFIMAGAGED